MKLLQDLLVPAVAAGLASAAHHPSQQPTEAYMLRQPGSESSSHDAPAIPDSLARAILIQRIISDSSPLGQLPESISQDDAVDFLSRFGKPTRPLFDESANKEPKQLVISFTGVTADEHKALRVALPDEPLSFSSGDVGTLPTAATSSCDFTSAIDATNSECWHGQTQYLHYDAAANQDVVDQLATSFASLKKAARDGDMETTIVLVAPSGYVPELRRRQAPSTEQVITDHSTAMQSSPSEPETSPTTSVQASSFPEPTFPIAACFTSEDACVSGTANCSGHGSCGLKWSGAGGDCYHCKCLNTHEEDSKGRQSLYHWGGNACEKIDVSTPFWLFASVTIVLVATVTFSVGLLFSIGEEKLPGVIGAGVSKTK